MTKALFTLLFAPLFVGGCSDFPVQPGSFVTTQPAATTQPASTPPTTPQPGGVGPKTQTLVNGAVQVLSQPDAQSQIAAGIQLGLQSFPPPYGILAVVGLLLAKDVVSLLKLKDANKTTQAAINAPGTTLPVEPPAVPTKL